MIRKLTILLLALAVSTASTASNAATAKCRDGTLIYAKRHQGACSHHGGVAEWYK